MNTEEWKINNHKMVVQNAEHGDDELVCCVGGGVMRFFLNHLTNDCFNVSCVNDDVIYNYFDAKVDSINQAPLQPQFYRVHLSFKSVSKLAIK